MSRTPEQIQNLRNLIRANRESQDILLMSCYHTKSCGTAYCAIGNYAHRTDLQSFLKLNGAWLEYADGEDANHDDVKVREHFGLDPDEIIRFFAPYPVVALNNIAESCTNAQQAADYIENYLGESLCQNEPQSK